MPPRCSTCSPTAGSPSCPPPATPRSCSGQTSSGHSSAPSFPSVQFAQKWHQPVLSTGQIYPMGALALPGRPRSDRARTRRSVLAWTRVGVTRLRWSTAAASLRRFQESTPNVSLRRSVADADAVVEAPTVDSVHLDSRVAVAIRRVVAGVQAWRACSILIAAEIQRSSTRNRRAWSSANASSCPTDDHHFVAFGVGDPPAILRLVKEPATGCDCRAEARPRGPTAPRARSGCGCAAGRRSVSRA